MPSSRIDNQPSITAKEPFNAGQCLLHFVFLANRFILSAPKCSCSRSFHTLHNAQLNHLTSLVALPKCLLLTRSARLIRLIRPDVHPLGNAPAGGVWLWADGGSS